MPSRTVEHGVRFATVVVCVLGGGGGGFRVVGVVVVVVVVLGVVVVGLGFLVVVERRVGGTDVDAGCCGSNLGAAFKVSAGEAD